MSQRDNTKIGNLNQNSVLNKKELNYKQSEYTLFVYLHKITDNGKAKH